MVSLLALMALLMTTGLLLISMREISSIFPDYPPEVTTNVGRIRGIPVWYGAIPVDAYLGVPYAEPPVGELRFKKPVPVQTSSGTIHATQMPPACPQYAALPFPWYDDKPGHREDCLYLNIWVPHSPGVTSERKAVMYWIFGGGFFVGSTREPMYDGKALAAVGDVIVVTVNYRLGGLGYLYSGTEDAPGNVALYDILEGLKWVNNNIENFGGDRSRITIMGQSSGAITVGIFAVSPLTKGLYRRIIMQSGSPAYLLAEDNNDTLVKSQNLAKNLSCANESVTIANNPQEVVECLRNVRASDIAKATALLAPQSSRVFLPRYGDDFIPKNPRQAIIDGDFHDTELLAGDVRDESPFSLTSMYPEIFGFFGEKNPKLNRTFYEQFMRTVFSSFENTELIIDYYLGSSPQSEIRRQAYTAAGDYTLLCPTVFFAESLAKRNDVYYYFFVHRSSTSPWARWMGVMHVTEVPFVFGQPTIHTSRYTLQEKMLSFSMMKKWTNFAKTGSPEYGWPLYSKEDPKMVILSARRSNLYGFGPHRENCDVFRPYFGF